MHQMLGVVLDGIVIDVVLVYVVTYSMFSHPERYEYYPNIKPHPGGYECCPADLAVTVAVQLLLQCRHL